MPHTKSVSVLFLPSTSPTSTSPLIDWWVNDTNNSATSTHEFSIRHSQSEPVISRSQNHCRVYIEPFQLEPLDLNSNSNLTEEELNDNEIDTNLLYPNWFSCSSISITSITSTIDSLETRSFDSKSISTEDLIHEMITIEGLRTLYSSCFACGVNWHQDHVTLDCVECGGYAMERPCPECDGKCNTMWRRNLSMTHDNHKANWEGECKLRCAQSINAKEKIISSTNSLSSKTNHQTKIISSIKV